MSLTKVSYSMIQGAVVNVLDYGADPTGATPSQSAFVAALATGKAVFIPEGTYLINNTLQLQDGQTVFGAGSRTSTINCDQTSFSGAFFNMGGHTSISHLNLVGINGTTATGIKCWDSANQFGFTGYITIEDVNIAGFFHGLFVNNIFLLDYQIGLVLNNIRGISINPAYSPSEDSGYCTTLTFYKVDIISNQYGIDANPTIVSKNIMFRDCAIELNSVDRQAYLQNCDPLTFENCYFEGQPTLPALLLVSCDTFIQQCYFNDTGGINLGSGSNSLRANEFFGTSATDSINGTGTSIQDVHIYNSQLGANTVLNISEIHLYYTRIGSTLYRNFNRNLGITLSGDAVGSNLTVVSDAIAYTRTVSATINAGVTTALISDQAVSNIWASNFTVGIASISNAFNPGLILTVTPATTGNANFFCVLATNTTASPITLTDAALKVLFFGGTGMAI
jgi:Pectate lyase superfamily protein